LDYGRKSNSETLSMKRDSPPATQREEDIRREALRNLQRCEMLMVDGHFDYGNGYHGSAYVNPHQLFQEPSLLWRLAQDLIDLLPGELINQAEVVAGPATGGALLAHTIAGLLDGRRSLVHAPCKFAPFTVDRTTGLILRQTYARLVSGKHVLLADDVRNTGKTLQYCAELVAEAGGVVIGAVVIHDRLEALVDSKFPHIALAEYKAPKNFRVGECPLCVTGVPVTAF
jgi:orotate phosphoribosyltransferase